MFQKMFDRSQRHASLNSSKESDFSDAEDYSDSCSDSDSSSNAAGYYEESEESSDENCWTFSIPSNLPSWFYDRISQCDVPSADIQDPSSVDRSIFREHCATLDASDWDQTDVEKHFKWINVRHEFTEPLDPDMFPPTGKGILALSDKELYRRAGSTYAGLVLDKYLFCYSASRIRFSWLVVCGYILLFIMSSIICEYISKIFG